MLAVILVTTHSHTSWTLFFGKHNQVNIEVFFYALSQSDGSKWRQRIQAEVEYFVDVPALSSDVIARMIFGAHIQFLIKLEWVYQGCSE